MPTISFEAALLALEPTEKISSDTLLVLPNEASEKLPSRGMVMVEGTVNGCAFRAALEPDGKGSHWFKVNKAILQSAEAGTGDRVSVAMTPTKEWPEPTVPLDLKNALTNDPEAHTLWLAITPMARWDWIRWIGATKQPETRRRRVESVPSRLKAGKRRPCCFDRSQCTLTEA